MTGFCELWEKLLAHQGETFNTARLIPFVYEIRGGEMFVSVREKSITRSTIELAYSKVVEMNGDVSGPKKLGVFGASYLFPIFLSVGVINSMSVKRRKIHTPNNNPCQKI